LIRSPKYAGAPILNGSGEPTGGFNPLIPYYARSGAGGIPLADFERFLSSQYPEQMLARKVSNWYENLVRLASRVPRDTKSWRRLAMAAYAAGRPELALELIAESADFDDSLATMSQTPDFSARIQEIRAASDAGLEEDWPGRMDASWAESVLSTPVVAELGWTKKHLIELEQRVREWEERASGILGSAVRFETIAPAFDRHRGWAPYSPTMSASIADDAPRATMIVSPSPLQILSRKAPDRFRQQQIYPHSLSALGVPS